MTELRNIEIIKPSFRLHDTISDVLNAKAWDQLVKISDSDIKAANERVFNRQLLGSDTAEIQVPSEASRIYWNRLKNEHMKRLEQQKMRKQILAKKMEQHAKNEENRRKMRELQETKRREEWKQQQELVLKKQRHKLDAIRTRLTLEIDDLEGTITESEKYDIRATDPKLFYTLNYKYRHHFEARRASRNAGPSLKYSKSPIV